MRLTNDCYLITLRFTSGTEQYYRDGDTWTKVTTRGRLMPATAEQVLNHLLPALAGAKPGVSVEITHRELDALTGPALDRLRAAPVHDRPVG